MFIITLDLINKRKIRFKHSKLSNIRFLKFKYKLVNALYEIALLLFLLYYLLKKSKIRFKHSNLAILDF